MTVDLDEPSEPATAEPEAEEASPAVAPHLDEAGPIADPVRDEQWFRLGLLVAWAPIVASVAWATWKGEWMAGDRSIMGVFTHDVFSRNTPLLGTVSTMGNYSHDPNAAAVHHLGPAQFWALSIPDWLTGGRPVGLLLGVLLVNCGAITLVAVFVRRRLGPVAAAGSVVMITVLAYGLGPSLLRDAWTPFLGLWPLLTLTVLTWSLIDGDERALPWAALVSGFLAQIELMFVAPAAVLSVFGVVGFLLRRRADRRDLIPAAPTDAPDLAADPTPGVDVTAEVGGSTAPIPTLTGPDQRTVVAEAGASPADGATPTHEPDAEGTTAPEPAEPAAEASSPVRLPPHPRPLRRPVAISVAVAAFMWWPVAYQEVTGDPGNLTLLIRALGHQKEKAGGAFVWHNFIQQLSLPPVWVRRATSPFQVGQSPSPLAVLSAAVFLGALVALTVFAWRRRLVHRTVLSLLLTTFPVIVAGLANLQITPKDGIIGLQYRRWLWPFGGFLWFALLVGLVAWAREREWGREPLLRAQAWAVPVLVAVAAVAVVPGSIGQLTPPSDDVHDNPVIESMWPALEKRLPPQSTYLVTDGGRAAFGVGPEIMRRLVVHGWDMKTSKFGADSYGKWRVLTRDNMAMQTLELVTGDVSLAPPRTPSALLAAGRNDGASAETFTRDATQVLERLRSAGPITLTDAGHQQLAEVLGKETADGSAAADSLLGDPTRAMFDRTVLGLIAAGAATDSPIPPADARRLLRGLRPLGGLAFLMPAPDRPSKEAEG